MLLLVSGNISSMERSTVAKRPVRLADVASVAGVSVGTASRVLNGITRVNPEATAAVRRAIDELGYVAPPTPNRRGRRAGAPQHNVGQVMLLLPGSRDLKWILDCAPVFAYVIHGIEQELAKNDIGMVVRRFEEWSEIPTFVQKNQGINGLIFIGDEPRESPPPEYASLPSVWVMGLGVRPSSDWFTPDDSAVGETAAKYLLEKGHRHCAALGHRAPLPGTSRQGDRTTSFAATITAAGGTSIELIDNQLVNDRNRADSDRMRALICRLLQANPRPTGLFLEFSVLARSVYEHLREQGIEPGRDIDVIVCDNVGAYLDGLHPKPGVVDISPEYIGQRAVARLLWRLKNPEAPREVVSVMPRILLPEQIEG